MAKAKKLPSGNWRVQLYVGSDENGKRQYKSFTAVTRKEAEYMAAEFALVGKEQTTSVSPTLDECMSSFLESKSNVLSPSTLLGYERLHRRGYESLKRLPINDITIDVIQRDVNAYALTHSPKSVRNYYGFLTAVFRQFRPDFCAPVQLPQRKKHVVVIPTQSQMEDIYNKIHGDAMELPFLLASQLGLRASEIAGLTRDCVDIAAHTVTVQQARVAGINGDAVKDPKSYAGNRTLPCNKQLCDMLLATDGDFVTTLSSSRLSTQWGRFQIKNYGSILFNFHALRHFFASRAMLQGIPIEYIAELMGHSSLKMLEEVYLHTFPDAKQQFANRLSTLSESFMQHEMQHGAKNTP